MTARRAMSEVWEGFRSNLPHAMRSAPRDFFAPVITLARWMGRVSQEGASPPLSTFTLSPPAKESLLAASTRLRMSPDLTLELAIHQLDAKTAPQVRGRYRPSALPIQRRPLDPESRNR